MSLPAGAWAWTDHWSAPRENIPTTASATPGRMKVGENQCKPLDFLSVMTALHVRHQFMSTTVASQAVRNTIYAYDSALIGGLVSSPEQMTRSFNLRL